MRLVVIAQDLKATIAYLNNFILCTWYLYSYQRIDIRHDFHTCSTLHFSSRASKE